MSITAAQVQALREKTGISMMSCKKALMETDGDEIKAIEILRKKGEAKAAEKADRQTGEGIVVICGKTAAGLKCETDFVARNEDFIALANRIAAKAEATAPENIQTEMEADVKALIAKLGENMVVGEVKKITKGNDVIGSYIHMNQKIGVIVALENGTDTQARDVAMHIAAMNPQVLSPTEVSDALVAKEKEIWTAQLLSEGKPANMLENILKGKENKFRSENALLGQPFVKDPSQTVAQYLSDAKVVEFIRVEV